METEAGQKPEEHRTERHVSHAATPTGALARFGWVLLALVACSLIVMPIAFSVHGNSGLLAAAIAAVVCLVAAGMSGIFSILLHQVGSPIPGFLLGMLFRMGFPLSVCLAIHLQGGWLSQAGFAVCLLVYYPVALAIETWSDVVMISRSQTISGGA